MNAQNKGAGCPVAEALAEIEKANMDFDKRLEKDAAACGKKLEAAKKRLKKASETKAKVASKKKELAARMKKKPTAAIKGQIEKNMEALKKAMVATSEIKDEVNALSHVMQKCSNLIKRRQAEAKVIANFRKDEAKKEALKAKAKVKAKAKAKAKKPVKEKAAEKIVSK